MSCGIVGSFDRLRSLARKPTALFLGGLPPSRVGVNGPKPYKFIGLGDVNGPKPYKFIGVGNNYLGKSHPPVSGTGGDPRLGGCRRPAPRGRQPPNGGVWGARALQE
jgi:hypothetical protein